MWDQRFDRPEYVYGTDPSQFLAAQAGWLQPGLRGLAIADGEGRNSVFMASRGMQVTAMDGSAVALEKARALAAQRGVQVDFHHADLADWPWPEREYDVIAAIFFQFAEPALRQAVFAGIRQALRPGGVVLLHGYARRQIEYGTGGPGDPELLYTTDLLADAFAGWDIRLLRDYDATLAEGCGHAGRSALIDLVAVKPA